MTRLHEARSLNKNSLGKFLSDDEKHTHTQLASQFNVSRSAISKVLAWNKAQESPGRPHMTNSMLYCVLVHVSENNPLLSAREIYKVTSDFPQGRLWKQSSVG